jgi:hypothetical protein
MLRSFTVIDPHLVNLIRENPRYTKMMPEEILEKFVSGRMMVKEARYVDDALNGPLPIYEPQPVALKDHASRSSASRSRSKDAMKMRWCLSSSASISRSKDAKNTPPRIKQREALLLQMW